MDTATAPALRAALDELISNGARRLVLDLRQVQFLDGRGLTVLLEARDRLRVHDGSMNLICLAGPVLTALHAARVDADFGVHPRNAEKLK